MISSWAFDDLDDLDNLDDLFDWKGLSTWE